MNFPNQDKILEFLEDKNLIVVSNRGPVEFYKYNSKIKMKRGAGGLVSTLLPVSYTHLDVYKRQFHVLPFDLLFDSPEPCYVAGQTVDG